MPIAPRETCKSTYWFTLTGRLGECNSVRYVNPVIITGIREKTAEENKVVK